MDSLLPPALEVSPLAVLSTFPRLGRLTEFFQREEFTDLAVVGLGLLIASQLITILAAWASSRLLVDRDDATFLNALKLWGSYLLLSIVLAIAAAIVLPLAMMHLDPWRRMLSLGGFALLSVLLMILVPIKIYTITFLRALGLLLIAGLLQIGVSGVVNLVTIRATGLESQMAALATIGGRSEAEKTAFFLRLSGHEAPDEIDRLLDDATVPIGPRASLAQREAQVRILQQKLAVRKRTLPPNRTDVANKFQAQLIRYVRFLNEVNAERTAQPVAELH